VIMKTIAVFDEDYHDESVITIDDGIRFLFDIYRLAKELNLYIHLKEKKERTKISPRLKKALEIMDELDNCYVTGRYESFTNIIDNSDISIGMPFTTPCYVALTGGRKAIWHDVNGKFKNTIFGKMEFTTHNYNELRERTRCFIGLSDEEFMKKIRAEKNICIKDNPITTFRKLLAGEKTNI